MHIYVSEIPEQGIHKTFSTHLESKEFSSPGEASVVLDIIKVGTRVFIRGSLCADILLTCCRCLENYSFHVDTVLESCYAPSNEASDEKEHELTKEDLEVSFYRDDVIDLNEFLIEQILLTIPMRILCSAECKGLCHMCGQDLNKGTCHCKGEQ